MKKHKPIKTRKISPKKKNFSIQKKRKDSSANSIKLTVNIEVPNTYNLIDVLLSTTTNAIIILLKIIWQILKFF